LARAFGVTALSVKRAVKALQEHGVEGFFQPREGRGPAVLTAAVVAQAQQRLDQRQSISEVAQALGLKVDTLRKAVLAGK
jgi:transposase-like protein